MNRFAETLAGINDRLDLPQPRKYRIMQEIAADLEDTFGQYRAAGLSEREAEARAVERIAADDSVIGQLIEIHETPVRRWLRGLPSPFRMRMERGLWIVLLAAALCLAGIGIAGAGPLAGSPYAWITGALTAMMVSIAAGRWYVLVIAPGRRMDSIWQGLRLLLFLAGLTGLTGTLGFFGELEQAAYQIARTSPDSLLPPVSLFTRSLLVMSLGIAAASTGAVMWFILVIRALAVEDYEWSFRVKE